MGSNAGAGTLDFLRDSQQVFYLRLSYFLILGWGNTAMSSSPQDSTPSRAEMELEANLYFSGTCFAPTSKWKAGAEKEQPSLFKKALFGLLFTNLLEVSKAFYSIFQFQVLRAMVQANPQILQVL
jgi:hypothetical protein